MWCVHLLLKLFFLNVFAVIATSAQWAIDDSGCRTPDGGVGNCITVTKCQSMKDFLRKSPKPIPKDVLEAARAFICGVVRSGRPKVCCPSGPIEISRWTLRQNNDVNKSNPTVNPPDVTGHSNIGLLPENCGLSNIEGQFGIYNILGGDGAEPFEFPWMALLWYQTDKNTTEYRCAGTVVNDRYILTAAHCVVHTASPLVRVSIGEYDIGTTIDYETEPDCIVIQANPVQNLEIEQVLAHPDYNRAVKFENDIALIRTAKTMKFSPTGAWPICLPQEVSLSRFDFTNKFAIITGWGVTEKQTPSKTLMKARVPMMPIGDCKRTPAFKRQNIVIDDRQLCADTKLGADACKADSGGPLQMMGFLNDDTRCIQHGIVSFGTAICRNQSQVPGVYTRVAYYMDWILDTMRA